MGIDHCGIGNRRFHPDNLCPKWRLTGQIVFFHLGSKGGAALKALPTLVIFQERREFAT